MQKLLLLFLAVSSFPFLLERLFSNTNEIESATFHLVAWSIFVLWLGLLAYSLLAKKLLPNGLLKTLGFLASVCLVLLVLIFADRIFGRISSKVFVSGNESVLYPPNTKIHYKSFEMDFTLHINQYGFRESGNIKLGKKKKRVACIGDSFTLGWGVEEENSWPALLEKMLKEEFIDVEVLNWGKGGYQPQDYLNVAKELVPKWKPDLLIVSTFQLDDLFQLALSEKMIEIDYTQEGRSLWVNIAYRLFPNIWDRLNAINFDDKIDPMWEAQAKRIWRHWPINAVENFEALPDSVQQYFRKGELNPWIVDMNMRYLNWPDSLINIEKQEKLFLAYAEKMNAIKQLAEKNGTEVLFQLVPFRGMLSAQDIEQLRALGLFFDIERAQNFQNAWEMYLSQKNFPLHVYTECMKEATEKTNKALYLDLDGHFSGLGNRAFVECLYPTVKKELN